MPYVRSIAGVRSCSSSRRFFVVMPTTVTSVSQELWRFQKTMVRPYDAVTLPQSPKVLSREQTLCLPQRLVATYAGQPVTLLLYILSCRANVLTKSELQTE